MAKVQVMLNVDDEVVAIGKALIGLAKDIQAKASIVQDISDVAANLGQGFADLANLGSDLKASPDNRAYLGMVLEQVADAFINPPAAPVVAAAVK